MKLYDEAIRWLDAEERDRSLRTDHTCDGMERIRTMIAQLSREFDCYRDGFPGFVYRIGVREPIEWNEPRIIKIGWSVDPQKRLSQFQTGCPMKLDLWELVPAMPWAEGFLHQLLAHRRIRGEWFNVRYDGDFPEMLAAFRTLEVLASAAGFYQRHLAEFEQGPSSSLDMSWMDQNCDGWRCLPSVEFR